MSRAAVALVLRGPAEAPGILFIKRASRDGDPWSGQMAFPGGRYDPADESEKETAIRETEEEVFLAHPEAIHLRNPQLYGPRQLLPREWPIVRRALDKRPFLIVPDGGLTVKSQAWSAS